MMVLDTKSIIEEAEAHLSIHFKSLDQIEEHNFNKVLHALTTCKVGEEHFSWVSGYGHDDMGREKIDEVFAKIFNTEAAIVRPHFVSGTHTISCCFFGCLRPGDELVSIVGTPYDTLHEVIGIGEKNNGSLKDFGITYKEIPLNNESEVDLDAIPKYVSPKTKMVFIQRSKGYENRKCLSISDIEKVISIVKKINKNIICFVDNCFGEFTEKLEPTDVGADLTCGSLIKNLGGGIVPAGGYIAGNKDLVLMSATRLTAPGIGDAGGCMFDLSRVILQGLFHAPKAVIEVLKGISLTAYYFEKKGFQVNPKATEIKSDIVVAINLGKKEYVEKVCKMVQANSPVNSHLTPISCNLPGYEDEVIMAGGTFIEGSTIELSCDAPIREPFTLYWQGGLSYYHTKAVLSKLEL
jgi:cystathionine beta-lyase family protein involved in aluminum resistance